MTVNMHEAKTRLSELVRLAETGEEVIIARDGKPAVKLNPCKPKVTKRELGFFKGLCTVPDDFDDPLPDDILDAFYS